MTLLIIFFNYKQQQQYSNKGQSSGDKDIQIKHLESWVMVFNAIFKNISVTSWRSVLLVEETEVPGENLSQATLSYNVVSSISRHERDSNSQL